VDNRTKWRRRFKHSGYPRAKSADAHANNNRGTKGRAVMAKRSRVSGTSKLRRQLRRFPEETRAELKAEFETSGKELRDTISANAPEDEGYLKEAAHYQVSNDGLSVVAGYSPKRTGFKRLWKRGGFTALWQEFGTKQHRAQPFISPSFRQKLPGILARIEAAVNKTIKNAQNYGK
jgi:HK97 gp10 family phage protein